ncbi:MAG: HPF/RaiA family ribosome-associated protein [Mesonia hippocampi]|uniref:HPF/RaiA family ribosome-associated protein n=1 Tax=Mesonia hippocampi TaxID=1628250 RepID=UPI003F9C91B4
MDINFNYVHVTASERLEGVTSEKLNQLKGRYDFIVGAQVYYKKENASNPEEGKIVEIELSIPGPRLFATASQNNYDSSLQSVIDDLKRQLEKRKGKMSVR